MNQPYDGDFRDQRQSRDELPRPVTANVRSIIGEKKPKIEAASCHPGLWLDKFARPGNEMVQYDEINQICLLNKTVSQEDGKKTLTEARARRERNLAILGADAWTFIARTTGPFTLHLARASALENSGICLHPVYGFPYIPGSALKGMAQAYACEVWLEVQPQQEKQIAWEHIRKTFGWAPSSWLNDLAKRHMVKNITSTGSSIGSVVFHDAWPLVWPKLICDIVNNHHDKYYSASEKELKEKPQEFAPGDWENPVPAYFLAVAPGAEFDFPLSLGEAAGQYPQSEELMELVCLWLLGAFEHRGAGAKTNTGYGRFQLSRTPAHYADIQQDSDSVWEKATDKERGVFREETFTLEFVSPAFLAGANQGKDDCDLRPSTLRGDLRWWWRTMHAGHLDVATLKKLEDAIWGSAEKGGAIQIDIQGLNRHFINPIPMPGKLMGKDRKDRDVLRPDPNFIRENGMINANSVDDKKKTTQGFLYLSFGMDEMPTGKPDERNQRQCLSPGIKGEVIFTGRSIRSPWSVSAEIVLEQATAAFYLLCAHGGIGAKSRKGFGSITLPEKLSGWSLDNCRESAKRVQKSLTKVDYPFEKEKTFTPSIDSILQKEILTPWNNPWFVLDQLGFSYQFFAQEKKHQLEKKALGLPRIIGIPEMGKFNPTGPMKNLRRDTRHSSPFFFHLDRDSNTGDYTIRVTAFPARFLPDLETSREMLKELLEHLDRDLHDRVERHSKEGRNPLFPQAMDFVAGSAPASRGAGLLHPGDLIEATLLEEKTKKGGWKARQEATGMSGHIVNSDDVPLDKKPGDTLTLVVKSGPVNEQEIVFLYPTTADKSYDTRANKDKP